MFSAPLRSERKTICLPSRDQRGWESNAGPEVIRVAVPPAMGMVYRSPTSSNTMVLPSGETSRDIQVPSDVENETVRVVLSGRSPFFLPVSARARTSGEAARAGAGVGWTGTSRPARVTARIRCIEAPKRGVTAAGQKLKASRRGVKQNRRETRRSPHASGNPWRALTETVQVATFGSERRGSGMVPGSKEPDRYRTWASPMVLFVYLGAASDARRRQGRRVITHQESHQYGTHHRYREVVQRREGLRLHHARERRKGLLRASHRYPGGWFPFPRRGSAGRVRSRPGREGPGRAERHQALTNARYH